MITVEFKTPIPIFGKVIIKLAWCINYPANMVYYQLQTNEGITLKDGNWTAPENVVNAWGLNDDVISNALLAAKPWEN